MLLYFVHLIDSTLAHSLLSSLFVSNITHMPSYMMKPLKSTFLLFASTSSSHTICFTHTDIRSRLIVVDASTLHMEKGNDEGYQWKERKKKEKQKWNEGTSCKKIMHADWMMQLKVSLFCCRRKSLLFGSNFDYLISRFLRRY